MSFKTAIVTLLLFPLIYACKQENNVEKMKAEVMAIHDEVMPEMDNLMNLQRQLKSEIDRLDSAGETEKADKLKLLVQQLQEADEAMMQWMRKYKDPSPDMNEERALEYLQAEKESISNVKKKINISKAAAKEALTN
jgi:hypothetical protein